MSERYFVFYYSFAPARPRGRRSYKPLRVAPVIPPGHSHQKSRENSTKNITNGHSRHNEQLSAPTKTHQPTPSSGSLKRCHLRMIMIMRMRMLTDMRLYRSGSSLFFFIIITIIVVIQLSSSSAIRPPRGDRHCRVSLRFKLAIANRVYSKEPLTFENISSDFISAFR